MRDVKQEQGLGGNHNWPKLHFVSVQGDTGAQGIPIEQWKTVAVLEVNPPDAEFQIAFKSGDFSQRLRFPVQTENGCFGMRIGPGDVDFFTIPTTQHDEVQLRLVELTDVNDPKYPNLPLY